MVTRIQGVVCVVGVEDSNGVVIEAEGINVLVDTAIGKPVIIGSDKESVVGEVVSAYVDGNSIVVEATVDVEITLICDMYLCAAFYAKSMEGGGFMPSGMVHVGIHPSHSDNVPTLKEIHQ